jgi:apolipoprotein D and lipocalin family protein
MRFLLMLGLAIILSGCATTQREPIETAKNVNLQKFMGTWYVIASIPTFLETEAYNAVERYTLTDDGHIQTVFSFRKGGFDGPLKKMTPTGFVVDDTHNSTWRMRFIWPFKAEYLISYVSPSYNQTLISRNKRDYFWIMARTPHIPKSDLDQLLKMAEEQGYDMSRVRKVPQSWDDDERSK